MAEKFSPKTFPLTVSKEWLDKVEKAKSNYESKHDFILKAVSNEIKNREGK